MKFILVILSACAFSVPAFAQEFGAALGFHQTTADTDTTGASIDGVLGFKVGALVGMEMSEGLKFRSGLLYSQRHVESKFGTSKTKINFDYIDIPANVQYNVNEMFGLFGGLTFAINVADEVKPAPGTDIDAKKILPLLDLGVNLTFSDMFGFDFYYQRGMGGIANNLENYSTFGGNFLLWF